MIINKRCMSLTFTVLLLSTVMSAETRVSDDDVVSSVDQQLAEWWLKPEERSFDQIGWADDIRSAKELAAKHQRPVFLFTMDGRVNTGRC